MSKTTIQFTIKLDYHFTPGDIVLTGTTTHNFNADVDMNNHIDVYKVIQAEIANLNTEYLHFRRNNNSEFEWSVKGSDDIHDARVNLIKLRENSKVGELRYILNEKIFKYKVDAKTLQEVA